MPATDRERYWKAFDAARRRYEGRAMLDILSVLEEQGQEAAKLIEAGGLLNGQQLAEDFIRREGSQEVFRFYERTYGVVVPAFAEETFLSIKSDGPSMRKQGDVWLEAVRQWLAEHGAEMVSLIQDTTVKLFRQVLDEAVVEGEGSEAIARRLNSEWPEISRMRARRIGRTEVIRASNHGSITGARQVQVETGLALRKEWIETFDGRTRDSHFIEGTVGLEEPFDVGGYPAMYPGDASLPASESVNCRCTVAYVAE